MDLIFKINNEQKVKKVTELLPNSSAFSHNNFKNAKLQFKLFLDNTGEVVFFHEASDLNHPYSREAVKLIKKNIDKYISEEKYIVVIVNFEMEN
ncbi:hypothetical protein [Algibacillus agarilyticus]|uniref:hypothetical protein n=1 Tax=Algibacillus agarilyticus TaxID=2234133 RepID=UPI0013007554|nr:hypothetical protein [Algibacillus agarilyticus]